MASPGIFVWDYSPGAPSGV